MDAATLYSTKPYSPPNKDSEPYKWVKAALSTSPVVQGALIGAGIGYFQGQTWELTAAGALSGALIAIPGAAYGTLHRSIPLYIYLRHGVAPNDARFKNLKKEAEQDLKEMCRLSDRVKHVTFLALGIGVTYHCLPKSWIQGIVSFLPSAITNLPKNLQSYANTPALEPGLEELGKTALKAGLFLSNIATSVTRVSAYFLGFTDFKKFVGSSALVFSVYKGGQWIGSFKSMQPVSKYVKETYQNPPAFFDLMCSLGSAATLYRFGTYLKTLPLDTDKGMGFFSFLSNIVHLPSYIGSLFSSTTLAKSTTFSERWNEFWSPTKSESASLGGTLYTFWNDTFIPELLKACSFGNKSDTESSSTSAASESQTPVDPQVSASSYEPQLRTFLYHASPWLILGALVVHTVFRYYVPLQKTPNTVTRRAATLETLSTLLNVIQTSISKPAQKLIDYFPALERNHLNPLHEELRPLIRAYRMDRVNTVHGRIVRSINGEIAKLKNTFMQLKASSNADPKVKFETAALLIKAFELKLQELQYRFDTEPHPANFQTRNHLVQLAQAHAFLEISRLYKEQITLAKELKNQLETMNAPQSNVDSVNGSITNLEKAKAEAEVDYRGKQAELAKVFTNVMDWDVTLDRIFDTDEVHLSYFQEIPQSILNLQGRDVAAVPAGPARNWLQNINVQLQAPFINNPMKILPKLTADQRNALRRLNAVELASLGLRKVDMNPVLFPQQGMMGEANFRAMGATADERGELQYLALNG